MANLLYYFTTLYNLIYLLKFNALMEKASDSIDPDSL